MQSEIKTEAALESRTNATALDGSNELSSTQCDTSYYDRSRDHSHMNENRSRCRIRSMSRDAPLDSHFDQGFKANGHERQLNGNNGHHFLRPNGNLRSFYPKQYVLVQIKYNVKQYINVIWSKK